MTTALGFSPNTGRAPSDSTTSVLSEPTTSNPSISSAADSHARISALLGRVLGSMGRALDSGASLPESLGSFDPGSSLLRTSQRSLVEGLDVYSGTYPRSGMMRSGTVYPLPPSAPLTKGTGSSSWPTVTVHGNHNRKGASAESGDGLATAVRNWPTPRASENENRQTKPTPSQLRGEHGMNLATAVNWPTPTASDHTGPGRSGQGGLNLRTAAAWATPTAARDWRSGKASEATHARNSRPLNEQVQRGWPTPTASMTTEGDLQQAFYRSDDPRRPPCVGQALNPAWVEQLQGFPDGWTEVGPQDPESPKGNGKRRGSRKGSKTDRPGSAGLVMPSVLSSGS